MCLAQLTQTPHRHPVPLALRVALIWFSVSAVVAPVIGRALAFGDSAGSRQRGHRPVDGPTRAWVLDLP